MSRHEDVSAQVDRLTEERLTLADRLDHLARIARLASKGRETLDAVYRQVSAVRRAEEAVDIATLDLATARGEDA